MTPDTTREHPVPSLRPSVAVTVPAHIVYRAFPAETVMLNLTAGTYHGLNATAGRMLEELERAASLRQAANTIAQRFAQPQDVVERDMRELCELLLERGLIEIDDQTLA